MSKTETYLAEYYTEDLKKYKKPDGRWHIVNRTCHEHKFGCQRFSEKVTNDILFLEQCIHFEEEVQKEGNMKTINITKLRMKLTEKQKELADLKQAIKLYEDAGI